MSSNNYAQGGTQTSFDVTATPNQKGSGEATLVNPYTVGYIATFVGKVFDIGIDVNTADHQERLLAFEVSVGGTVIYSFQSGPTLIDPTFNGNGFFDFLLKTVDLPRSPTARSSRSAPRGITQATAPRTSSWFATRRPRRFLSRARQR